MRTLLFPSRSSIFVCIIRRPGIISSSERLVLVAFRTVRINSYNRYIPRNLELSQGLEVHNVLAITSIYSQSDSAADVR